MNTIRYTVRRTPYGGWGLYDAFNQTYVMFGADWDRAADRMKTEATKLNRAFRAKARKEACHA